jgi:CRP-like cAMP-binding protein
MRTPLPPPAEPVVSRRIAEFLSGDRQFRLADGERQPYSHPWRNAPLGGSGRLDTNPVTPLKSLRHHPLSDIARFVHPGDVLGVSFQDRYLFTAEAVIQVKVRGFARGRFFALINESPALRPQLIAILCDEMSAAQDQLLLLGRKTAEERVISFLLWVRRKGARSEEIELPMSRQDIADYLGLTIEWTCPAFVESVLKFTRPASRTEAG